MKNPFRLAILISGRGSNMTALAEAIVCGDIPNAEIVIVISDNPDANGLAVCRERGIKTTVIERRERSRKDHDADIVTALHSEKVDLVCLAGYMRVLSPSFIEAFRNRILNIHPSLLPSFPGLDAQQQALAHGVKWSGCTVHFVDESLDGGPIIAQRVVPVLDDDSVASLSIRILEQEHLLYPEAVALIASGKYQISDRRVVGLSKATHIR